MFSGIVEELGIVQSINRRGNLTVLEIKADKACKDVKIGDSIAVNGVCLTFIKQQNCVLSFEMMQETSKITNLGALKIGEKVNLERALKLGDRISGHIVSGHIDCVGVIRKKIIKAGNLCFEIAVPLDKLKNILLKGSICVDGISLTVQEKKPALFSVFIIPYTLKNTTLGFKGPSSKVNVEIDK